MKLSVFLEDGNLFYKVFSDNKIVIDTSMLGIIRDDTDLSRNLTYQSSSLPEQFSDDFRMIIGKTRSVSNNGISQSFTFSNEKGHQVALECRLYDDGLALRYSFPGKSDDPVSIQKDLMEYNLSSSGSAWLQPYDTVTKWTPAYERYFENAITPGTKAEYGNGWCFPALFQSGDHWILLSEGGMDGDYAGSHLDNESGSKVYRLRWPEKEEAMGLGTQLPSGILPWETTWKTIAIGDLNTIVNSNLINQVSPPGRISNTSWIKPGRASWSWLVDHDSPKDFLKLKTFVDLAVEMNWEYSLVDANWQIMKGGDIKQLVDYANSNGIGILLWYNSGGPHNEVEEGPRDIMNDKIKRKEEFAKLWEWGVKGVKIDFFQSDKQFIMKLYREILEDAAEYQIMVNFHGCAIPRGWQRTYPNLLTLESARGEESYTFASEYPERAPELNTILPFTRNVIGSMDLTPVVFTAMQYPHNTTYGHEIALSVIFESGLLHFGDGVEGYQKLGEKEKEFLKGIPVVWDELKLIQGTPGREVILARRNGEDWYIGGINGGSAAKKWNIDLSFLDGDYSMLRIVDGNSSDQLVSSISEFERQIEINVLPYGGFVMRLISNN